jgi:hypothetical protein
VLKLDLRVGEGVDIDSGRILVRVESKSGQKTRLSFEADKEVPIRRIASLPTPASFARRGLGRPE